MGAPTARKRRKKRVRLPTAGSRLCALLLGMGAVVGVLVLIFRLVSPGGAPEPTPTPTAEPTATPEPTPSLPAVDLAGWELQLISYDHPLGEDFVPPRLTDVGDGQTMDSRVATYALNLISAAKAAGYSVYVCSGYRDYETQSFIYWRHINDYMARGMTREEADAETLLAVNYPGCSEHQSGLCVDILETRDQPMEPYIGGSGLMLWLEQHCAEQGFVIRYPDGKTDITGIEYEPWHLRYVGREAAAYMMEHGLCLEEFLGLYSAG